MPDMTPDREESLRRKLEDLEDAYGPAIRKAKATPGCTDIAVNADGMVWQTVGGTPSPTGEHLTDHAARRIVNLVSDIDQSKRRHCRPICPRGNALPPCCLQP
jgi:type IV secretion system protein TrbB